MSLLGTMAEALDGKASFGCVICRNRSISLGDQPWSLRKWGVRSVKSCTSCTRRRATALDRSERLLVFNHVSTSANVMAQGMASWMCGTIFTLMFHLWYVPSCGSLCGLVKASFGSSAKLVTQYVMRNLVRVCRVEALSCHFLNQMCEVGVFVCLVCAGEMGCKWTWMDECYIISPGVLVSNPCLKCYPEIGRFDKHVAARLTRHPTSTCGFRELVLIYWSINMC